MAWVENLVRPPRLLSPIRAKDHSCPVRQLMKHCRCSMPFHLQCLLRLGLAGVVVRWRGRADARLLLLVMLLHLHRLLLVPARSICCICSLVGRLCAYLCDCSCSCCWPSERPTLSGAELLLLLLVLLVCLRVPSSRRRRGGAGTIVPHEPGLRTVSFGGRCSNAAGPIGTWGLACRGGRMGRSCREPSLMRGPPTRGCGSREVGLP